MNTKNLIVRTVIVFAALALAGLGMAIGARSLADAFDQMIVVATGIALFGGALVFFLIRIFAITEK